jgi:erythronate-4-phosphate dehydrogenase
MRSDVLAVLDVWDNEPELNLELMALATIATPHIAGYSRRAKTLATKMLAEAFAKFLHGEAGQFSRPDEPPPEKLVLEDKSASIENFVSCALPIHDWSAEFKLNILNSSDRGDAFDKFRKSMVNRAEFSDFEIEAPQLDHQELMTLKNLGFKLL